MPGFIHHVTGDLVTGMRYERKIGKIPEESGTFHSKELLGKIQATDYPARVDQVCTTQPPPPPQKKFNPKTNKTEQFKPEGTFYAPNVCTYVLEALADQRGNVILIYTATTSPDPYAKLPPFTHERRYTAICH